ncbi:MAG: LON peptidase substrate-binding domain-containing protein [Chloroflexota bacterium]|nr:LON peptidase substrate-binding domain-containing protein [Chloroflexota bacterium]
MRVENLPLFPLRTVLFPGMILPLHIFEERYKRMIADCLAGDPRLGVALISEGLEVGGPAQVHDVGAVARIVRVGRYEDGRMDLITVGMQRFHVLEVNDELPYLRATVEVLDDDVEERETLRAHALTVYELLLQYREMLGLANQETPWTPDEPEALSYVAGGLDLPLVEKQSMLETRTVSARLTKLAHALEREIQLFGLIGPTRPAPGPRGVPLN